MYEIIPDEEGYYFRILILVASSSSLFMTCSLIGKSVKNTVLCQPRLSLDYTRKTHCNNLEQFFNKSMIYVIVISIVM